MLFYQNQDGYCYNSDSIFLYDFISLFKPRNDVLDVGCGCGILGLLAVKDFGVNLTQNDIQKKNIYLTKKNARINKIKSQVILGDFLKNDFDKKFDFIISNPPFYKWTGTIGKNEIKNISRYNKFLPLDKFLKKVNSLLKPKGEFIFCYDSQQFIEIVKISSLLKMPIIDIRFLYPTNLTVSHLVLVRIKKSSKSPLKVHKPLLINNKKEFSNEAKKIFKKSEAYSIKCQL